MSTHKHFDAIAIAVTVFTLVLTVLFMNGEALGLTVVASEGEGDELFTDNDLDGSWDTSGATRIALSDDGSTVSGNGAYVNGGDVYIVYAGKYVLTGALSDGSVIIDADGDDKIWLMLDGVSLRCEDGAAIDVEQADKVFLTLKEGTENTVSSGAEYGAEVVSSGIDGAIYSRDDLTVNGSGALTVTAGYRHGIVCNDDLVIAGGTVTVDVAQDAIHANDSVRIRETVMTLSAGDDGITVSNDDGTAFFYMDSGQLTIPACYEGIEAAKITIAGGVIDIDPTDDGLNANGNGGNSVIYITGGDITITDDKGRDADGIDSNGDIFISGGRVFVSVAGNGGSCAIDYGSENGGVCVITGGTVLACGSSTMAEGFDSSSTQGFLMVSTTAAARTNVALKDADGKELLSETVPCSFSSLLVSTPEMRVGDACTLSVGGVETQLTVDNASSGFGGFGGMGGFGGGSGFGGRGDGMGKGGWLGETGGAAQGGDRPDMDDAQPPEPPAGMSGDGTAPGLPENGDGAITWPGGEGMQQPDGAQGTGNFAGRFDRGNMAQGGREPWGTQNQGTTPQAGGSGAASVSPQALLLTAVSILVLLAGCLVALFYRRRG